MSSGFHVYMRACCCLLRVLYASHTVQEKRNKNAQLARARASCAWRHTYTCRSKGRNAVAEEHCGGAGHLPYDVARTRFEIHGYKGITENGRVGSHLVPMILHWPLKKKGPKGRRGQKIRVNTYPTVFSRPSGRRVQSLVQIRSEMWICISSIHTYKQTKNHFIFIYKINKSTARNDPRIPGSFPPVCETMRFTPSAIIIQYQQVTRCSGTHARMQNWKNINKSKTNEYTRSNEVHKQVHYDLCWKHRQNMYSSLKSRYICNKMTNVFFFLSFNTMSLVTLHCIKKTNIHLRNRRAPPPL